MYYLVSVTDFHEAVLEGLDLQEESRVRRVRLVRTSDKLGTLLRLPYVAFSLLLCCLDRKSVAVISHPFNPWFALFARAARNIHLYDDGTAYYLAGKLPTSRLSGLFKRLSSKHFRWDNDGDIDDYQAMLKIAQARALWAVFPDQFESLSYPVLPVNLDRAFPAPPNLQERSGEYLFLDIDPVVPIEEDSADQVLAILRNSALKNEHGRILYKAHPNGSNAVSAALSEANWAQSIEGSLERNLKHLKIDTVYSFSSSGAIAVRLYNPEATIVNFITSAFPLDAERGRAFYKRLGADEISI